MSTKSTKSEEEEHKLDSAPGQQRVHTIVKDFKKVHSGVCQTRIRERRMRKGGAGGGVRKVEGHG